MKLKILLILFFGIFLMSFISSLDVQQPQICGGDEELLIGCIGDDELIFLSGIGLPEDYGSGSGAGAAHTTIEEEIPEEIELEEPPFEEVVKEWLKKWWWIILLLCFVIFLCRKKKCEGCKKRFLKKDLKKYKGYFYCRNCYEKVNIELKELRKNYNVS